jgi:SAM-dependent methyltransferase
MKDIVKSSDVKCPLCEGETELKDKAFPSYETHITYSIYHCFECKVAFTESQIVDTSELYDNIYRNGSKVRYYNRYWEFAENVKKVKDPLQYLANSEETYWGVRESLSNLVKDKSKANILEVGSGLGYLTFALNKDGYNTIGLDISKTAVTNANLNFGKNYIASDIYEYVNENPGYFDIVVLTEVIEHVSNPISFIEILLKLVKPNGKVILTTPNKSFYPSNITWSSDLPPVHLWWFSEDSISFITNKLSSKVTFLDFTRYYKINAKWINPLDIAVPAFDENGRLLEYQLGDNNFIIFKYIRSILSKVPFIKKLVLYFKKSLNNNVIICKNKGPVTCAIIERN